MADVNDFTREETCEYKGEVYRVRDNGAVMRLTPEGRTPRRIDNIWTFGKPNEKTGYMDIGGQRVHRIVACAFHGNPPTEQHVVDHIDTNRKNNRVENLRWLTKLENILLNPYTRMKIEYRCGSVENFLKNPSMLKGYESQDHNVKWMRAVTKEEAENTLKNWKILKESPRVKSSKFVPIGDWIFRNNTNKESSIVEYNESSNKDIMDEIVFINNRKTKREEPLRTQSLTPNAIQLDWKYPVEFPCCPQQVSDNPLKAYMANLKVDKLFSKNDWGESTVLDFGITDSDKLWVMCNIQIGWKTHAITKITYKDGIFYHKHMGVYDIGDDPEELFEAILKGEIHFKE